MKCHLILAALVVLQVSLAKGQYYDDQFDYRTLDIPDSLKIDLPREYLIKKLFGEQPNKDNYNGNGIKPVNTPNKAPAKTPTPWDLIQKKINTQIGPINKNAQTIIILQPIYVPELFEKKMKRPNKSPFDSDEDDKPYRPRPRPGQYPDSDEEYRPQRPRPGQYPDSDEDKYKPQRPRPGHDSNEDKNKPKRPRPSNNYDSDEDNQFVYKPKPTPKPKPQFPFQLPQFPKLPHFPAHGPFFVVPEWFKFPKNPKDSEEKPSKPNKPNKPVVPKPDSEESPEEPEVKPSKPNKPNKPNKPVWPKPDSEESPEVPEEKPSKPNKPNKPVVPKPDSEESPEEPEVKPSKPSKPTKPNKPDVPSKPSKTPSTRKPFFPKIQFFRSEQPILSYSQESASYEPYDDNTSEQAGENLGIVMWNMNKTEPEPHAEPVHHFYYLPPQPFLIKILKHRRPEPELKSTRSTTEQ